MEGAHAEAGREVHPELKGFYFTKLNDGRYMFGRPIACEVVWSWCELTDLLNLGIERADIEAAACERQYRVRPVEVLLIALG